MKINFKVLWSKESKLQRDKIVSHLQSEWTEKEVDNFLIKLRSFEKIIIEFPELYAESKKKKGLRRAVLSKHNSVIYKVDRSSATIKVYTIFDNRQHPDKLHKS